MAGLAKSPALKSDTGELFAGCEKLGLSFIFNGRGGQIRTDDPLLPKQMRYQAALRPDCFNLTVLIATCQPTRCASLLVIDSGQPLRWIVMHDLASILNIP